MTSTASPTARVSNRPTTGLPTEGCQVELRAHGSSGAPRGGRARRRSTLPGKADVRSPLKASTELSRDGLWLFRQTRSDNHMRAVPLERGPSEGHARSSNGIKGPDSLKNHDSVDCTVTGGRHAQLQEEKIVGKDSSGQIKGDRGIALRRSSSVAPEFHAIARDRERGGH